MIDLGIKEVSETMAVSHDWSSTVGAGEIATSTWVVAANQPLGDAVLVGAEAISQDKKSVSCTLSGGRKSTTYTMTNRITISGSTLTYVQRFQVTVGPRP